MTESVFEELRRYMRFGAEDEAALRKLAPHVLPQARAISDSFYDHLQGHAAAAAVFSGPAQVERLKGSLVLWLRECVEGPWDAAYASRRARIGRVHVQIALPQRFMFGAMGVIGTALVRIAHEHFRGAPLELESIEVAIGKLLELELAMMLDTYADSREELVRQIERSRTDRLAALGTMAAGLAHEIRNPLNGAMLQLQLVRRRLSRPSGADLTGGLEAANVVVTELNRLAAMVDDFLHFARPHALRLMRGSVTTMIDGLHALLSEEAKVLGVELVVRTDRDHTVLIDQERFKQVLINIVQNAMQAAGEGGHVLVRSTVVDGTLRVDIEDDGPGLPSPDAPVFEPFYTTKEKGTGLGLSIAHRIVSDHGGRIDVASRPGRTVFSVLVPAGSGTERSGDSL